MSVFDANDFALIETLILEPRYGFLRAALIRAANAVCIVVARVEAIFPSLLKLRVGCLSTTENCHASFFASHGKTSFGSQHQS